MNTYLCALFCAALLLTVGIQAQASKSTPPDHVCSDAAPAAHAGATQMLGWGTNWNGQMGTQRTTNPLISSPSLMYVSSSQTPRYSKVAGGLQHTMVLEESTGRVFVAGDGSSAQLGGGVASTKTKVATFNSWEQVLIGKQPEKFTGKVIDIAAGWYHSCVLAQDATDKTKTQIFCAGKNNRGQLGNSSVKTQIAYPIPVEFDNTKLAAGEHFTMIAAGVDHMAAVTSDNNVWTWGAGESGEIGESTQTTDSRIPFKVSAFPTRNGRDAIEDLQCGFRFCIALSASNLWGWGLNDKDQLGFGTSQTEKVVTTPRQITTTNDVTKFAVGGAHTLVLMNNDKLHSFGSGTMGQSGHTRNDFISQYMQEEWSVPTPKQIQAFANANIASFAAGMKHSVVLDNCGKIYTMGAEALGNLGHGSQGTAENDFRQYYPKQITSLVKRGVSALAVFASSFNTFIVGKV